MVEPTQSDSLGDQDSQILQNFRRFARGHVDDFGAARNRASDLLGTAQPYLTGVFREALLRKFLRKILPGGVAVDSGVIYGFEKVANSSQIDILVWDNVHHPPVFREENLSIVAPESVIAAISVKTRAERKEFESAIENLMSIVDLDRGFRQPHKLKPILKIAVFYDSAKDQARVLQWVQEKLRDQLESRPDLLAEVKDALREIDPFEPAEEHKWLFERIYPRMFVAIGDPSPSSIFRGWGPPNRTIQQARAEEFRREPYVYRQGAQITTPIEKLAYHVLSEVMLTLGTPGGAVLSAWGDFHPQYHFRVGDAGELHEESGLSILPDGK